MALRIGTLLTKLARRSDTQTDSDSATLLDMPARHRNHTGSILLRSDGRWRGRVQLGVREDGTPDVRTVYGKTKPEVRKRLDDLRARYESGQLVSLQAERLPLAEFLTAHYLPAVKPLLRPGTYGRYAEIIRLHVNPRLGSTRLGQLTPRAVQVMLGELLDEGLSPYTVRSVHRVLHRALVYAVRWRMLPGNPVDLVEAPRLPRIKRKTLTVPEIRRLVGHGPAQYRLLWGLALVTGARQGELLGLHWQDLDADAGVLAIRRSYGKHGYQHPKNGKSRRVPLPRVVVDALLEYRASTRWSGPTDPIFASRTGTPLLWSNVTRTFKRLLREVGISPEVRFHDLRHTHATLILQSRAVPTAKVAAMLGHYSPSVTYAIYDHSDAGGEEAYRQATAALIGG